MTDDPMLESGKLPPEQLARLLAGLPPTGADVVMGPGVGLDCAVVRHGGHLLVCKSDPITFVADDLGHYLVQVNANDVATTGATPRWLLVTLLLPAGGTPRALPEQLMGQISEACERLGIALIGGHTEVTTAVTRPVAVGALLGEVTEARLVTPQGARPGDRLLLTKGVPLEGTAILASDCRARLADRFSVAELDAAAAFLERPGISVVADARIALAAGRVNAMHDPTEGGVKAALWELAQASGRRLRVEAGAIPVPALSRRICSHLGLDPLATIASGALLLAVPAAEAPAVRQALDGSDIPCADIGGVEAGPAAVIWCTETGCGPLAPPGQDELARLV
ncbi:AIR synthase family protein [Alkalilimnicola ehrlichii MLHE-1]|uniref:AIR synthase related protein domain protein n=1 Tax=Alkalilimnicola ehrlichii (strain ATCC BAA-1101 / DSM 17681 / MLHE-1) TaxID=187272 RepID=Q0A6Y2_ALKEH|nr:AIR synthase family protein [Alkalilimnicola ehrlichii]ABI57405.1 AIR synthase related protein domain protein [Alkalilimnicola ehrlichii MLHE-1]